MQGMPFRFLFQLICCSAIPAIGFAAAPVSGEAVYQKRCAGCHEQNNERVPRRQALQQMSATRILRALDFGAMMTVAYPMSREDRQAVATYLGTNAPAIAYPPSAYCSDRKCDRFGPPHCGLERLEPLQLKRALPIRGHCGTECRWCS